MLLAKLLELFFNWPLVKGEDKGHKYIGYGDEHKQAQGPAVAGFGE